MAADTPYNSSTLFHKSSNGRRVVSELDWFVNHLVVFLWGLFEAYVLLSLVHFPVLAYYLAVLFSGMSYMLVVISHNILPWGNIRKRKTRKIESRFSIQHASLCYV
jgi:hypothetical protein